MQDRQTHQIRREKSALARFLSARRARRNTWRATRVVLRAAERFLLDDGLYMASALAFSLIIAIFPFVLFATATAGIFGGTALAASMTSALFDTLPDEVAGALEPEIWNVLVRDRGGLMTFGAVVMLASVTSMVETIRGGLNRAYGVVEERSMLRTVAGSMLFVMLATIGLVMVAMLAVVLPFVYGLLDRALPQFGVHWNVIAAVRLAILAIVLAGLLWAIHRWLPAHRDKRPALWPGILLTLVLWYLAGQAFSYYMESFADYARYYAGLAGIVAAMLFFYIAAVIVLFAGAFNRALAEDLTQRRAEAAERA